MSSDGWTVDRNAIEEYVAQNGASRWLKTLLLFLRFEDDLMEKLKYDFYSMTYYAPRSVWVNKCGCTYCAMACFSYDLDTKEVKFWIN